MTMQAQTKPSSPSKLLLVYLPGSAPLLAGHVAAKESAAAAPHLASFASAALAQSVALSDVPRNSPAAASELAHLLGLDVMPRGQYVTAIKHLYPSTSLAVLTASPAAHILASDLSLHSTLLATPSLTAEHLASAARKALAKSGAALVHLPYYTAATKQAELEAASSMPHAARMLSPHVPHGLSGSVPPPAPHELPAVCTDSTAYLAVVDGFLDAMRDHAAAESWITVVVSSWDQANLTTEEASAVTDRYPAASSMLGVPEDREDEAYQGRGHDSESEDESTFGPAHKRTARTQAGLPLTAWYLHPGVADANRDPAAALDVLTTGTNAAAPAEQPSSPTVGAWYFLKDLTEKMARTSLTATI